MEIRNLITFTKVAEVQSLSKAAKELEYAQSTVTMQMQQLEQELGVALYERVGRKIRITQAGQELLTYANHIIKMSEAALQIGKTQKAVVDGILRIGILEAISSRTLSERIQIYLQRYPCVKLQIQVAKSSRELLELLRHNELDLAMTLDHYLSDSMVIHALDEEEEVHFYASYESALNQVRLDQENFPTNQMLLRCNKDTAWELELEQSVLQKKIRQVSIQNQALAISMAERQMGILLLPDSAALEHMEQKRLRRLDYTLSETKYWRQTIYHRNKWLTGAMRAWLDMRGMRHECSKGDC